MSDFASEVATPKTPFWVPNLDSATAAVLAVPMDAPYPTAIKAKLIRLLQASGQRNSRDASEHLELKESQMHPDDFPAGWADQILACNNVKKMVSKGNPETAAAASVDVSREALAKQATLSLGDFYQSCSRHLANETPPSA